MKLYGVPLSPFVRKVLIVAAELGIELERVNTPPGDETDDFRKLSPFGRIPAVSDGDFGLTESSAINRYLIMKHDSELMGGASAERQARIAEWERFADEILMPAIHPSFRERVVKPIRLKVDPDEALVSEALKEAIPAAYGKLESLLTASDKPAGTWLMGDEFSHADVAVGTHLFTARLADILPDAADYPAICQWYEALAERGSAQAMLAEVEAFKAKLAKG